MKFLCDVHIPIRLSKYLAGQEAESVHVNQILNGSSTSDELICQHADANDLIVITKDLDFRTSYFLQKTPHKLIRTCLGNISNNDLIRVVGQQPPLINRLYADDAFYTEINAETILLY